MTEQDSDYIARLLADGQIAGPVVELGAAYGGVTCRDLFVSRGIEWYGTDFAPGPLVSFVVDFEDARQVSDLGARSSFGSVLVLNVLEHCMDPVSVLDNCLRLARPGGSVVVLTPAIWPLHDYPMDAWRMNPNFLEAFAKRRQAQLALETFEYVGFGPVRSFLDERGAFRYPHPWEREGLSASRRLAQRIWSLPGGVRLPAFLAVAGVLRKAG